MGTMWLKSILIPSQGINIPSMFDGAEDVLVVKFGKQTEDKQWTWLHSENL